LVLKWKLSSKLTTTFPELMTICINIIYTWLLNSRLYCVLSIKDILHYQNIICCYLRIIIIIWFTQTTLSYISYHMLFWDCFAKWLNFHRGISFNRQASSDWRAQDSRSEGSVLKPSLGRNICIHCIICVIYLHYCILCISHFVMFYLIHKLLAMCILITIWNK
jgi:hypothetical protein